MRNSLFLLLIPLFAYSDSLKELIVYAKQNNDLLQAKAYQKDAKAKELQSSQNSYYPTLDLGANYMRHDDPQPFSPQTSYTGFAKLSLDLYSGGKKYNTLKQKENELSANQSNYQANKELLSLEITQEFFRLKSMHSALKSKQDAAKSVAAQLDRMKKFYEAKLTTSDTIDRLQAAYDSHIYAIESLRFEIFSLHKKLELKVGKEILHLDDSTLRKTDPTATKALDAIEALQAQKKALEFASETIESSYYPNIKLEDTYSLFAYEDEPLFGGQKIGLLEKQNALVLTLNMRVFDFGVLKSSKEALMFEAKALESEVLYRTKEQKIDLELAKERIKSAKINIVSANSTLVASKSALTTITEKYTHKLVDNIVYLDALSAHTQAEATYHEALYKLESAYALYYFYHGKNIEEYLDE